jgi:putative molybdopterin biosynthesis protein
MAREFLEVIDAEEAHRRFRGALGDQPLGEEEVALDSALGRVLADDVRSAIDVPGFDRSNVDGWAVRAEDVFVAGEGTPRRLQINPEEITPGVQPTLEVQPGTTTYIATGGMLPRGADAVVMVEYADREDEEIAVRRAAVPGAAISFAGSDIPRGETVLRQGIRLTARETGTLAALGLDEVRVFVRPRVAVFSTGDEIVTPGRPARAGLIFDSNLRILCDTLRELGCKPVDLGVVADDEDEIRERLERALEFDAVILSGGTSKGQGDLNVPIVAKKATVLCHGVAVKPGKPICLAITDRRQPVVVLPGFPTSAVFTFHEFVVPALRVLSGAAPEPATTVQARSPLRINSDRGRTEFVLVSLMARAGGLAAYPLGKGSGSITTFARADGFLTIDRQQEFVEVDEEVEVRLLGREIHPADLVVIGSHCPGLDRILSVLAGEGVVAKTIHVGSQGALLAATRGECDLGGIHLANEAGVYNTPFLKLGLRLIPGYGRMQGIVYRDELPDVTRARMVNRNRGSGTRLVIDELLAGATPPGHSFEARGHNGVGAAVAQGRADWGVTIASVAEAYGLGFKALREERYDFVSPDSRRNQPGVIAFEEALSRPEVRASLAEMGFVV